MGTSASINFVRENFPPQTYHWKPDPAQSQNIHSGHLRLVYDESTFIMAQKHLIKQFESLQVQLESFLFRKLNSNCFVTAYDILLEQTPSVIVPDCMINEHNRPFAVVLERTPYKLSDIGLIRFQQMLYILEQCFKGLNTLWIRFGKVFYIDEDLIFFNCEGKCKIWINENPSKNSPNINSTFMASSMILQLFELLESRLDSPPPQYYYRLKGSSQFDKFSQALSFVQKTRKKFNIQTDSMPNLRIQFKKEKESDSLKAVNWTKKGSTQIEQHKNEKFSLKNSRNAIINKLTKGTHTVFSKDNTADTETLQTFEVERNQVVKDVDDSRFLRSTFKSVKNHKSVTFTEYSEKWKQRTSPRKKNGSNSKSREMVSLNKKFKANLQFGN